MPWCVLEKQQRKWWIPFTFKRRWNWHMSTCFTTSIPSCSTAWWRLTTVSRRHGEGGLLPQMERIPSSSPAAQCGDDVQSRVPIFCWSHHHWLLPSRQSGQPRHLTWRAATEGPSCLRTQDHCIGMFLLHSRSPAMDGHHPLGDISNTCNRCKWPNREGSNIQENNLGIEKEGRGGILSVGGTDYGPIRVGTSVGCKMIKWCCI